MRDAFPAPAICGPRALDDAVLARLRAAAGPDGSVADPDSIDARYRRNVTALTRDVPLVLRPADAAAVREVVAVANAHRVPLYPFSTGRNWGLGSKLPVVDGCVVVDLSRLNRIVAVDQTFGYAILEPGVTQAQLAGHLRLHHPSLTMNFTGSFAHTGIVGNVLDRGDGGHARVDDLLGVRGLLGSGEPFAVGGVWEHVGTGRPSHHSRFAAGPDLCGLFCQSNFGIVTQLAFRLIHRPEAQHVLYGVGRPELLEQLVDALAHFGRQGTINRGSVNLGYANRFVQSTATMQPADTETAATAPWNFYVLLGGIEAVAAAAVDAITAALRPLCASVAAYRVGSSAAPLDELPAFLHPIVGPLTGAPDEESVKLIYQLTGTPLPEDAAEIDADQTALGMKCCIPLVPFEGRAARRAAQIVSGIGAQFDLNVKLSFFGDGRTLITIHFRRDDEAQVRRATACEAALWEALASEGFGAYRASIDQMPRLVASRPTLFDLVAKLKAALDPNGIISPGRYARFEWPS